jgi:hypothetical protein
MVEKIQVDAYKTADGKVFNDSQEAKDHEDVFLLTRFCEIHSQSNPCPDDPTGLADWLLEHAKELHSLLSTIKP